MFRATSSHFPPLKLVLALHRHVCDHHGQHSFVHIDPGNSIAHLRLLPEAERMPKMKLFRVSGYCCATATTVPTYSLNNACAGPANLSASTSPLDVRSRRSRSTASVTKAQLIFMMFRELRLTRRMNCSTRVHLCVFAKLLLPAWETGSRLFIKDF
jgi:hypothetical protein